MADRIDRAPCGCIPDCTLYDYPTESSFGILDTTIYYSGGSFSKNARYKKIIQSYILYKTLNYTFSFKYVFFLFNFKRIFI